MIRPWVIAGLVLASANVAAAGTVPDVTGLSVPEAVRLLTHVGFRADVSYADGRPANLVFAQEPPGFASRPAGTRVKLRAGTPPGGAPKSPDVAPESPPPVPPAPGPRTVPTLIGMALDEVRTVLRQWPTAVEEQSLVVPSLAGKVIHQWPHGGEVLAPGDPLVVVVGTERRPTPNHQNVPSLEGKSVEEARAHATAAGFKVDVAYVQSHRGAVAAVRAQFPLAGSLAVAGSAIRIRVPTTPGQAPPQPAPRDPTPPRPQPSKPPTPPAPVPSATLTAPVALLPSASVGVRGPLVGFDWRPVPGAAEYEVEIEHETAGGGWARTMGTLTAQPALREMQLRRGRYRWRVRALASPGGSPGPWSTHRALYVYGR